MIITLMTYSSISNAPHRYKVCIKDDNTNLIYQADNYVDIVNIFNKLGIVVPKWRTSTKVHKNYDGIVTAIQEIMIL